MLPDLRQTTLSLIRDAERISGYPVDVRADDALALPASVSMARGAVPFHAIVYNPRLVGELDYAVAVQAGFVIRHFAVAPDERVDLAPSPRGQKAIGDLVRRMIETGRGSLPTDQADVFAAQLHSGLGRQFRSAPVQLRIDDWLGRDHPEFREAQVAAVRRQLLDDEQALQAQGRIPAKVVRASLSMNAAVALYWAGELADDAIAEPYRKAGFAMTGRSLLKTWHRIDARPTADRTLIDAWAYEVGVAGWFMWVPYNAPAAVPTNAGPRDD